MAARSRAWDYGRALAGIASSNPAWEIFVSCECCVLTEVSAMG